MDLRQGEHLKLVRYYVPVEGTKVTTKQGSPESLLGTEKDRDRNIRPREDCRTLFSRRTKRRVRIAGETLLGLGGGRKGGRGLWSAHAPIGLCRQLWQTKVHPSILGITSIVVHR